MGSLMFTKTQSVGKFLLDILQEYGVEHIFGVPGDYVLPFDKQIEQHTIKYINATQENTAGYMADAYARLKGLGVACITYGVGISITNALSLAYAESSPIVLISGSPGLEEFAKGQKLHHLLNKQAPIFQMDTTQLEIFKHFTVDQAVLTSPANAQIQIERVLYNCYKQKKPVYIEIPRDVAKLPLPEIISQPQIHKHSFSRSQETPIAIKHFKHLLEKCERPVIWAGHEILRYALSNQLLSFARHCNIPIASTLLGKTVIDEHDPLALGVYQGKMSPPRISSFVEDSDCLILLGTLINDVDSGIYTAKLDIPNKVCVSSSEVSICNKNFYGIEIQDFIHALAEFPFEKSFNYSPRRQAPITFKAASKTPIKSQRLFECISAHLTDDHLVATDFGDCLFGSIDFKLSENSFLASAYFGSLGFGSPAAVAAQLCLPHRRVIGIIGDGAFQMTCTELSTAVRYGLSPIIIVLNNHGYGTERPLLEGSYNDIQGWNYSLFPQLLNGGKGFRVNTEDAFLNVFQSALQNKEFCLIEVELEKTDFSEALNRFLSLAKDKRENQKTKSSQKSEDF